GGGCARFNISLNELIAALLAIGFTLSLLIGNRNVMLGLPGRRDAQIKGDTHPIQKLGCGHGRSLLLKSSARPEEFVEQIAEPTLENVNLGLGDRNIFWPIVGDAHPLAILVEKWRVAGSRPAVRRGVVGVVERSSGSIPGIGCRGRPLRSEERRVGK